MKVPPMFPRKRRSKAERLEAQREFDRLLEDQMRAAGYAPTGEVNGFGEKWAKAEAARPNTQTEQERP